MTIPGDIRSAVSREQAQRLLELARDKVVLEIGSEFGMSTIAMAEQASLIVAIDWHRGDVFSGVKDSLIEFRANLRRYGVEDVVVPIVGRSFDVAFLLKDDSFDLVFVDGDHSIEAVRHDCELARRACRDGGIIACHDCGNLAGVEETAISVLGPWSEKVQTLALFEVSK